MTPRKSLSGLDDCNGNIEMSYWQPTRGILQPNQHWTRPRAAGGPSQVRVTFQADLNNPLIINNASIGIKAATGNVWDTAATPVELLFAGAHGLNIAKGTTITSDWANLAASSSTGTVLSRSFGVSSAGGGWNSYALRTILGPITGLVTSLVVCMDNNAACVSMAGGNGFGGTDQSYYFGPSAPNYNIATPSGGSRSSADTNSVILIESQ